MTRAPTHQHHSHHNTLETHAIEVVVRGVAAVEGPVGSDVLDINE